jgi:hypothetical protein
MQQWLRERASILRYTYFACLVLLVFGRRRIQSAGQASEENTYLELRWKK